LAFDGYCLAFGPNSAQAAVPFSSLHTFQLRRGNVIGNSISAIVPHTLRVVELRDMGEVAGDVIEGLFYQHFQSLERFEVDAADFVLTHRLPLAQAVKLQYFRARGKGKLSHTISETAQIPLSLIEPATDLPDHTPEQVHSFAKVRKHGLFRVLDIGVINDDIEGWEDVWTLARSLGIQFSWRCVPRSVRDHDTFCSHIVCREAVALVLSSVLITD
jgi:hypothetical protein